MDSTTDTRAHATQATDNFGGYILGLGLASAAAPVALAARRQAN